jgi:hypothetical protein
LLTQQKKKVSLDAQLNDFTNKKAGLKLKGPLNFSSTVEMERAAGPGSSRNHGSHRKGRMAVCVPDAETADQQEERHLKVTFKSSYSAQMDANQTGSALFQKRRK